MDIEQLNEIPKEDIIEFSAKAGLGMDELEEKIKDMFYSGEITLMTILHYKCKTQRSIRKFLQ